MALNFPSTPAPSTTYTFNNKTWTYNGNAWALSSGGSLNTSVVPEGTNLYFTNARSRAVISVSGSGTYDPNTGAITINQSSNYGDSNVALLGYATNANVALKANVADLKTANVAELTNLYFTNSRARTSISVTGSGSYDNTTGIITITGGVSSVNGQTGATTGFATTANSLSQFASTTSAQLATLISDDTGSGALVFATTPTLVTPELGLATGTSVMLSANIGAAAGNVSGNFTAGNFQTAGNVNAVSILTTGSSTAGTYQTSGNVNSASELVTGSLTAGTLQTAGNVNASNLRVTTASSLGTVQSGTWNGSSISVAYTDAKIVSVSNTAPISATTTAGAVTVGLLASGVTAGTYGGATVEGVFTVDTFGRITSASNVTAQVANSSITGNIIASQIQPTGVTASTYGGTTNVPVITIDPQGRITFASNVAITAGSTASKSIAFSMLFGS